MKHRMVAGADNRVKISRGSAVRAGVAFAGQANALAVARAGLDADFERFGALDRALAVATRAGGNVFPRPMAAGAGHVALHPPAGLVDLALAAALRTSSGGLDESLAMAIRACIAPSDVQAHDPTANRRPEGHVDLILQILARLRTSLLRTTAAAEDAGENIFEAAAATGFAPAGAIHQIGKVEAAEIEVSALRPGAAALPARKSSAGKVSSSAACAGVGVSRGGINIVGIEADLVVNLALLGIAKDVVGLGHGLEFLFRGLVSGIDVGMILSCELAKRLADIVSRGRLLHAKNLVIVF